jgi:hypothetical protein
MEVIAFWTGAVAIWLFFRLTTSAQRRTAVWNFWTALFIFGGAGVIWSAFH